MNDADEGSHVPVGDLFLRLCASLTQAGTSRCREMHLDNVGLCALVSYLRETVEVEGVCDSGITMVMMVVESHDVIAESRQVT